MVSEQERKEAFLKVWFDAPENIHWAHGMSNGVEKDISDTFDRAIAAWNTRTAPAATDTGLETVKPIKGMKTSVYCADRNEKILAIYLPEDDYVTRSQAEELLAAKDADIDRVLADNRRCLVRIAELEAKLDTANALVTCCCGDPVDAHDMGSGHSPVDQYHYAMMQLEAKLAAAEKINDAMRKAAVDYCWQRYKGRDPLNLKNPAVFTSHEWEKIGETMDAAARAVLGGKPS